MKFTKVSEVSPDGEVANLNSLLWKQKLHCGTQLHFELLVQNFTKQGASFLSPNDIISILAKVCMQHKYIMLLSRPDISRIMSKDAENKTFYGGYTYG